jgi:hypothetical protein
MTEPTNAAESAGDMLERLGCDAVLWAAEFRRIALKLGYSDMDEGWLICWFANAIEQSAHSHPDVVRSRLAATRLHAGAGGGDALRTLVSRVRTLVGIPMNEKRRVDLCILTISDVLDPAERELATLSPGPQADEVTEATHRHKKSGTEYVLEGIGNMQTGEWRERRLSGRDRGDCPSVNMREVAIYRSVDDGSLWVCPREEFENGRFEALRPAGGE